MKRYDIFILLWLKKLLTTPEKGNISHLMHFRVYQKGGVQTVGPLPGSTPVTTTKQDVSVIFIIEEVMATPKQLVSYPEDNYTWDNHTLSKKITTPLPTNPHDELHLEHLPDNYFIRSTTHKRGQLP